MELVKGKKARTEGVILVERDADGRVKVSRAGDHLGRKGMGWELQNLWAAPGLRGRGLATQLLAAARAEAAARRCSRTVHFTCAFQARALYERNGYEQAGRVENFPSGTDVLWYRKRLNPPGSSPGPGRLRHENHSS